MSQVVIKSKLCQKNHVIETTRKVDKRHSKNTEACDTLRAKPNTFNPFIRHRNDFITKQPQQENEVSEDSAVNKFFSISTIILWRQFFKNLRVRFKNNFHLLSLSRKVLPLAPSQRNKEIFFLAFCILAWLMVKIPFHKIF